MEKKSKVNGVSPNGTWESKYGLMYKFEVSFENGDVGEYNSKTQDQTKFVNGQEADYSITSRDYNGNTFYTVKPVQAQQSFGGGGYKKDPETEKRIARMSVLKVASDLVVNGDVKLHDLTKVAIILEQYVEKGTDTMSFVHAQSVKETNNDLPF